METVGRDPKMMRARWTSKTLLTVPGARGLTWGLASCDRQNPHREGARTVKSQAHSYHEFVFLSFAFPFGRSLGAEGSLQHRQEAITLYEKLKRDAEEQTFRPEQATCGHLRSGSTDGG